ncbi:hypothetical protein QJS04_geneDACA010433 [Acorus gramineus]|uniref:Uncharacterized protein n=1 Tax=Acorus gramineus TaxID=55184 RepID=A0AAV9A2C3_ACOGR|nr:hypothetical protein QJS04_geneDACA010433 [Acorus gramineus]
MPFPLADLDDESAPVKPSVILNRESPVAPGFSADASSSLGNNIFNINVAPVGSSMNLLVIANATFLSLNQQTHTLREACVDAYEEHLLEFTSGYGLGYSDRSRGFQEMRDQELPNLH